MIYAVMGLIATIAYAQHVFLHGLAAKQTRGYHRIGFFIALFAFVVHLFVAGMIKSSTGVALEVVLAAMFAFFLVRHAVEAERLGRRQSR